MNTNTTARPRWMREDGSIDWTDPDDFQGTSVPARPLDAEEQLTKNTYGATRSTSATRRFKCSHCNGTGIISVYQRGGGWDQIPERKKCWYGCVEGWARTDPNTLKLRREKAAQRKVAKAAGARDQAAAFLVARPDVAAWFKDRVNSDRVNEFADSLWDALHKYGALTPNQLAAVERQIESARVREQERAAQVEQARTQAVAQGKPAGLDLGALPSGMYAVPNGETRLKVRVNRPKANSRWHGFIFVDDGAAYGQRQNYGRQKPGGAYEGKIQDQLRAIMADPQAAMAAYGLLTGCCGHCGRLLEDEQSVARGIGPVCLAKLGW